ncbi:ADP-ribosylglycohydrolase [Neurospora crassa]|uniref:ADP-ribosylglycohydrolase n=1 Tax=Neurospora crassa (strain ATCC 24698 / 74-OR23-1A / CBS 708.71 / DSM 1257 / FGSC 987) TaxID=367110 RepID=Q7S1M3_NEUCR|nr:hypothetical protein NCU09284 [Neurospora crassa OR74A]EAA29267.1 hypothetical protein NCU09284 [Neurospora crassa OR74A]KHE80381.1 ADP-ribosylglycohydrolase [Neurospora crassa]|eukprot:XP_958503.1 hypothetical protein NCU09284 [Neurospora crassa OR74A]
MDFLYRTRRSSVTESDLLRVLLADRVVGALIGSALGDAIGLYTEFLSAAESEKAYPHKRFVLSTVSSPNSQDQAGPTSFKVDHHRAPHTPGDWTDDTDHCLLILLSFLHTAKTPGPGVAPLKPVPISLDDGHGTAFAVEIASQSLPTPVDLASRLSIWVQCGLRPLDTPPLGLGSLVGAVVKSPDFLRDPVRVAREYWERKTAPNGDKLAPNGSLMRTAPVGLMCVWRSEEETFTLAAELGRVTHADPRCVLACVVGSALVRRLVRGEVESEGDITHLIQRGQQWYRSRGVNMVGAVKEVELGERELWGHVGPEVTLKDLKLDEESKIGYVYKTLGAGVVLLRKAMRERMKADGPQTTQERFERLITQLVMEGGDADTNACFAGALLGALLGRTALPDHWKNGLNHGNWLNGKARALCRVLGLEYGSYNGMEDLDTYPDGGKGS